jgi:Phosphotransferase enzyme family
MLSFALSQRYEPGSSLYPALASWWRFLLESPVPRRCVVLEPAAASLAGTLASLPRDTAVERRPPSDSPAALARALADADLALVGHFRLDEAASRPALDEAVRGMVTRGGAVLFEAGWEASEPVRSLTGGGLIGLLAAEPDRSEAVPAGEPRASAWALPPEADPGRRRRARMVLSGLRRLAGRPAAERAEQPPLRPAPLADATAAAGGPLLVAPSATLPAGRLPGYLVAAAERAGHHLDGARWTILPPRGYINQKVVFTISPREGAPLVVKVTQDPVANPKLENELACLGALEKHAVLADGRAPRPLFRANVQGLALVGETVVGGVSFRSRARPERGCPVTAAAVATLNELALGTARRESGGGAALGAALGTLLERYAAVDGGRADTVRSLTRVFAPLTAAGDAVPAVFLHGDPTTFNMLVGAGGGVGLVDWENAEPAGPPLWDVVYFASAWAQWRLAGSRRRVTPARLLSRLLDPATPEGALAHDASAAQRRAFELDDELTGALVAGFWLYMAVREAPRMRPGTTRRGFYARLLERLTTDREALVRTAALGAAARTRS